MKYNRSFVFTEALAFEELTCDVGLKSGKKIIKL